MSATITTHDPSTSFSRGWTFRTFMARWSSQIGITTAFILLWITFISLAPVTFRASPIYVSFAQTTPYFALPALLMTLVIVSGDIDLSFVSIYGLAMVGFVAIDKTIGNVWLAALVTIAIGALAGLFNGALVTFLGIPALVITIGTQFLFQGLTLALVNGKSYALVEAQSSTVYRLLDGRLFGIPMQFVWLVGVAVFSWLILFRHRIGQNAHVVGDNRPAAQLMGIHITRTRISLFVLVGMASALAGLMQSLQVANFYPTMGSAYLLPALAAVFVGGTSVFGGRGTIWGTFIGAFMIGGIQAAIVAMGVEAYWVKVIYGGIILAAVAIHAFMQRRFGR
jgi:simple sugar transport system permease protein